METVELYGHTIKLGETPSSLCLRRWHGKMSPEPETVAWIESLPSGDVFYDIGANVGTFSVRAALRGLHVFAFEPVLANYVELCRIIELNKLPIWAFNLAMSRRIQVGVMGRGRSTHTLLPICIDDDFGHPNVLAMKVDVFALIGMEPNHVKIDVDGDEPLVLRGMRCTLASKYFRSVLVEVDPTMPGHKEIPEFMEGFGFKYDPAQVEACMIKGGKYDGTANYIFRRK